MKLGTLLFSIILVCINSTFAQETNNYFVKESDKNFLRNYKAPDFGYRGLTFVFDGHGQGTTTDLNNEHILRGDVGLFGFRSSNTKTYQRGYSASVEGVFGLRNDNADVDWSIVLRGYNNLHNRFYIKNNWFYGIHAQTNFTLAAIENNSNLTLTLRPAFSIGHGRIEPVGYARIAMDVERLLIKGNRYSANFSEENRKELADKIAIIQNKRFFDPRLGRIYRLQALDSVLQDMGVITEDDITYFSLLQDAFLYSNYTNRVSGFRHEFGITQGVSLNPNTNDQYSSFAFYKFSYYLPQSYVIQHNFSTALIGGLRVDNTSITANEFPIWLGADYDIGFYPNTRSFLSIGVNGGFNFENGQGFVVGTDLKAYYYISPRFLFSLDGLFRYGENYTDHGFNVAVTNFNRGVKETSYGFRLLLTYFIF